MSFVPFLWEGTREHFVKAHDVFQDKAQEHGYLVNVLRTYLPRAIENICESVQSNHAINILSIGSGDGYMDIEIIKIIYSELRRKYPSLNPIKMFNRAIEPQENHLSLYNAKTESLTRELSQVKLVFDIDKPKTFDEYAAEVKDPVPFHIVHFIHSAYFVDDLESTLTHCYNHELASKGMIVLVVSEKDTIQRVMKLTKNLPYEVGHIGSEVARVARKNGWSYEEHTTESVPIDVTRVFDEHSRDGNLLLDFLTYTMNFRANSNPEAIDSVLEIIKKNSTCSDGKILASNLVQIHFIFKN